MSDTPSPQGADRPHVPRPPESPLDPPPESNPYLVLRHIIYELCFLAVDAREGKEVRAKLNPLTGPWGLAETLARASSTRSGIPFATFDPVLIEAKRLMRELGQVVLGNSRVSFNLFDSRFSRIEERLGELGASVIIGDDQPSSGATPLPRLLSRSDSEPFGANRDLPTGKVQAVISLPDTKGSKPKSNGKAKGIPADEAEILVGNWLAAYAKDDPASITRDGVSLATGVSTGGVSQTKIWIAFQAERDAVFKPVPREVPLTDAMLANIPANSDDEGLAELIREQAEDDAAHERRPGKKSPRHERRHDPS